MTDQPIFMKSSIISGFLIVCILLSFTSWAQVPQIVSFTPSSEISDLPIATTTFEVEFDVPIEFTGLGIFGIYNSETSYVFTNVSIDGNRLIGEIDPLDFTFDYYTSYSIGITNLFVRNASNPSDVFPGFNQETNTWTFRTECDPAKDCIPPALSSTFPANNAVNQKNQLTLILTFNKPIQLGVGGLEIFHEGIVSPIASFNENSTELSINGAELSINEVNLLSSSEFRQVYVHISEGLIQNLDGYAFDGINDNTTFTFEVGPNVMIQSVSGIEYGNKIFTFTTPYSITYTFNQDIESTGTGTGSVIISEYETDNEVLVLDSENENVIILDNTLTIIFQDFLSDLTLYRIRSVGNLIEGANGQAFDGINSVFLIVREGEPVLVDQPFWPSDEYGNWDPEGDYPSFTLNRPVNPGSGKVKLYRYDNDQLLAEIDITNEQINFEIDNGNYEGKSFINLDFDFSFTSGRQYYILVDEGAFVDWSASAIPFAGISDKETWKFTIDGELPFEIIAFSPKQLEVEEHTLYLELEFSRPIKLLTDIGFPIFTVRNYATNQEVSSALDYNTTVDGSTLRARLEIDIPSNLNVYVKINADKIADLDDNVFPEVTDKEFWRFTLDWDYLTRNFSPENQSDFVSINDPLKMLFNEPIKRGFSGSFLLREAITNAIIHSFSFDDEIISINENEVLFSLSDYLEYNKNYFMTMMGPAIRSMNDIPVESFNNDNSWAFRTEPDPELFSSLIGFFPIAGAENVSADTQLTIQFSGPVVINNTTLSIYNRQTEELIQSISLNTNASQEDNTVTIDLNEPLPKDTEIAIRLQNGSFISEGYSVVTINDLNTWYFTTELSNLPQVVSLSPANGAQIEEMNPEFIITFDRPVYYANLASTEFIIIRKQNGDLVEFFTATDQRVSGEGTNEIRFTLNASLQPGFSYYVQINDALFKDENNEVFPGWTQADRWAFEVLSADLEATTFYPAKSATNVEVDLEHIIITFNRSIILNPSSTAEVLLYRSGFEDYPLIRAGSGSDWLSIDNNQLIIQLPQELLYNELYRVSIPDGLLSDQNDNLFSGIAASEYLFRTETSNDEDEPELLTIYPVVVQEGATNRVMISLKFSETIYYNDGRATILNYATNQLMAEIDLRLATEQSKIIGDSLVILPQVDFQFGEVYYLYIDYGAIIDQNRNYYIGIFDNKDFYNFSLPIQTQVIEFAAIDDKTYGDANFTIQATASSGLPVSIEVISGPAQLISDFELAIQGTGSVTLRASQGGNSGYEAASSVEQTFSITKAALSVQADNIEIMYNTAIPNLSLSYSGFAYDESAANLMQVPTAATNAEQGSDVGEYSIIVSGGQSDNYTFEYLEGTLTIIKANQQISIEAIADKLYTAEPFEVIANVDTNLPLVYEIESGPASITGNQISLSGEIGIVVVKVSQVGNQNYNAASATTLFFVFDPESLQEQTISFPVIVNKTYGDTSFTLNATASSGLAISYSIVQGPASLEGNTLSILGAGEVIVRAEQNGNVLFDAAVSVEQQFTINKASLLAQADDLSIVFNSPIPVFTISYLGFVYGEDTSVINTLPSANSTATQGSDVGEYSIQLSDGQDNNYSFEYASGTLTILKSNQTITIQTIPDKSVNSDPFALHASVNSNLPLQYAVEGPASIEGNIITLSGQTGTVTVHVSQSGTTNYNPTTESIQFDALPNVCEDFSVNLVSKSDNLCAGEANGSIDIVVSGGLAPYTYGWSNGAETPSLTGLLSGTYLLTAQDARGCKETLSVQISEPASLSITGTVTETEYFNNTGSINVQVSGGIQPYSFSWSNGSSSQNQNNLAGGNYILILTDANGCEATQSFEVQVDVIGSAPNQNDFAKISMFPNPSNGQLTILINKKHLNTVDLEIINLQGKQVHYQKLDAATDLSVFLDLQRLPKAMYLIRIRSGSDQIEKKLLLE